MGDLAPAKLDRIGKAVTKVLETAPDATVVMGTDGRIVRNITANEKGSRSDWGLVIGVLETFVIPEFRSY